MAGPFKMKGSPMARNFGAPFKEKPTKEGLARIAAAKITNARHKKYMETHGSEFTRNTEGKWIHNTSGKTVTQMNPEVK